MPNVITYNSLVWENGQSLPFPKEVEELIKNKDWSTCVWQSIGLPITGAKYTFNGLDLYQEELPNGDIKLKKEDFTGEILFGTYLFNPDKTQDNFAVSFKAIFLKGKFIEVIFYDLIRQDAMEFERSLEISNHQLKRKLRIRSSWWFKFLYRPYYYIIIGIARAITFILFLLKEAVSFVALFLTPW